MLIDKNFNKNQIIQNSYSDFDFSFKINPNYGDIVPLRDNNAIKASIRNLIMTSPYERPFNPFPAVGINDFIFEKNDPVNRAMIISEIERVLMTYETRLSDVKVTLEYEKNTVDIYVLYTVFDSDKVQVVNISLSRIR